ncbi:hypothetical protein ACJMK2_004943 [Sinanodonta woodiana]|uniref:Uncharacterized protein n=1 Tax=Sinanodonta woodiana TaxID=1069815 RepID=A0ABD3VP69_SINWO
MENFRIYRTLHVSKRDKTSPKPSNSIKSERTDSQNSGRTRDTGEISVSTSMELCETERKIFIYKVHTYCKHISKLAFARNYQRCVLHFIL